MPESRLQIKIRTDGNFIKQLQKTSLQVNRILALHFQKTGGTFVHCTWEKKTGPHTESKCTYKTRIVRGGAKKMRHHFAKEHLGEL